MPTIASPEDGQYSVKFDLPDKVTVRDQLAFIGVAASDRRNLFVSLWEASLDLISNWECNLIADPHKLDLSTETDPKITDIIVWVTGKVREYINSQGEQDPN